MHQQSKGHMMHMTDLQVYLKTESKSHTDIPVGMTAACWSLLTASYHKQVLTCPVAMVSNRYKQDRSGSF